MKNQAKLIAATCSAFLLAGCIEKEKIATIPDAENLLFTTQGDLIVSGGKSIYQVTKTESNGSTHYQVDDIYGGDRCAFGGIAQSGDWIFTVCKEIYLEWKGFTFRTVQDTHLLAANINERPLKFVALDKDLENDPMDAMVIPNGMDVSPNGELILADEDFFSPSSVARITLDYSGDLPRVAHFDHDWLGAEYGFESPNGVQVQGNKLYVSDTNKVRRLTFDQNGDVPLLFTNENGEEISNLPDDNEFYTGGVIVDDIMPYCDGIAVTHYIESKLVYQNEAGEKIQTLPLSLQSPTALAIGNGQGFDGTDLMVTEKGILLETSSNVGNRISRIPMDVDLADPLTCEALKEL